MLTYKNSKPISELNGVTEVVTAELQSHEPLHELFLKVNVCQ